MQPIRIGELKNGLIYYSHFDRVANVSGIGIKYGSLYDPPDKRGRAHLIEHIVAAPEDPKIESTLWQYLGNPDEDWKVETTRVSTFYGHESLLRKPHMLICFEIFTQLLRRRALNPEITEAERAAVRQEYFLRGIDSMPDLIVDLIHEAMYERNPARNRIDCTEETLARINRDDINQALEKYYVPNNMFVILLGPSHEEAKNLVKKYFDDLPSGPTPTLDYNHDENFPMRSEPKIVTVMRRGIHQQHVAIGVPLKPYNPKRRDSEVLSVLARILEKRLYDVLRKENRNINGGVYRVSVEISRSFIHGILYVSFATQSQEFAKEASAKVVQEMERLKTEKVGGIELYSAIKNREYSFRAAFKDTPGKLADLIIEAASNGDYTLSGLRYFLKRLQGINRTKILELANQYFTPNYVCVNIVPE